MHRIYIIIFLLTGFLLFSLSRCDTGKKTKKKTDLVEDIEWRNLHEGVEYVGMATCRSCHEDVYDDYIQTGMGRSLGLATPDRSDAHFGEHVLIRDEHSNLNYFPFWVEDSLYIHEFRILDGDTVHSRKEYIPYIIGSGNHTNSHLLEINGYIYQAPITFYTQKEEWDLAPGFDDGFNTRFERLIGLECMNCHNARPDFDFLSENKYHSIAKGIDCERCHGPGELHVREKLAGIVVDTSVKADNSIVNPARLNVEQQLSLCQSCHLQGVAVLEEGKEFTDFKPGMYLSDVLNIFLPRFEGADDKFIMASQAERLRMSDCFTVSNSTTELVDMSCITCHNPHISVKNTAIQTFNAACIDCHTQQNLALCSETEERLIAADNDCSSCHMPKSGSIDIPHVSITDHYIRKHAKGYTEGNITYEEIETIKKFIGLESMIQQNPTAVMTARGYLTFYERFSPRSYMLDSAANYLFSQNVNLEKEGFAAAIHYYFLKEDFSSIIDLSRKRNINTIKDSWTLYRIGEAYYSRGQFNQSEKYFKACVQIKPLHLEFQNKLAVNYLQTGNFDEAKTVFKFIIDKNPYNKAALSNLGFIYFQEFRFEESEDLLTKAVRLDPDYENAVFNLSALYLETANVPKAIRLLENFTRQHPDNLQARDFLQQIRRGG
ncbi:MAG: tetratricopeptide repeat protein [Chitinophagaceae bacterium]|nr:MAG: tetratricopeptide repeat protein [Chitinophagaceae bacterium]